VTRALVARLPRLTGLSRLNLAGLLTLAVLVAVWQLVIVTGLLTFQYLPAPSAVFRAALSQLHTGQLTRSAVHTLQAALIAWLLATAIGVAAGLLLGLWRPARLLFTASVDVLRTLPVVAFVPVAVLALGFSTRMEIAVAAWAALWPILINTVGGIQDVHPRLHEVGGVLRLSRLRRARSIVLPAAAPLILVGARLGLSIALIVTVVAEMIGNPAGLGYDLVQWQQALRPADMFADVLTVGILGVALNAALLALTSRIAPHTFGAGSPA